MKQRNTGGRFTQRDDVANIFEGMAEDLQRYEGQTILWYPFARASSVVDPIYDVGSMGGGRDWASPIAIPVLSVIRTEGAEQDQERGSYVTDTIHVVISYDQARLVGMHDIDRLADSSLNDRFIWNRIVYSPTRIQARGLVRHQYTVIGIDASQINSEELWNDADFAQYATPTAPA